MSKRSDDAEWKQFELAVQRLQQALDPNSSVSTGFLPDRTTDEDRQIDVLVTGTVGGRPYTMIIECRRHKKPVDVMYIDSIVTKRADVKADKAVIVSAAGFSKAAMKKAAFNGIDLLTLKDATAHDWTHWIQAHEVVARETQVENIGISFPDVIDFSRLDMGSRGFAEPIFTDAQGERWSIIRMLNRMLKTSPETAALIKTLPLTGERKTWTLRVRFDAPLFAKDLDGAAAPFDELEIRGDFYLAEIRHPLSKLRYADTLDATVAEYAEATFMTSDEHGNRTIPVGMALIRDATGKVTGVADPGIATIHFLPHEGGPAAPVEVLSTGQADEPSGED